MLKIVEIVRLSKIIESQHRNLRSREDTANGARLVGTKRLICGLHIASVHACRHP